MALPHYSQDQTSKKGKNFEPVLKNMFEVTILPPAGVGGQAFPGRIYPRRFQGPVSQYGQAWLNEKDARHDGWSHGRPEQDDG